MKLQHKSLIIIFAVTSIKSFAAEPYEQLDFNGFTAGMNKEAAKKIGMIDCKYGDKKGEAADSIYCTIPEEKRQLGELTITSAKVEFKPPNIDVVHKIHLDAKNPQSKIIEVLSKEYGQILSRGSFYVWQNDLGQEISILKRQYSSSSSITYSFDRELREQIRKNKAEQTKKQKTLDNF